MYGTLNHHMDIVRKFQCIGSSLETPGSNIVKALKYLPNRLDTDSF